MFAFAIEATGAGLTLVFVDVPFVEHHSERIARTVIASYGGLTHRSILADFKTLRIVP
jgi:hypothetical protein